MSAPIQVWTWPTPNGHKVHIMLEETGLPYEVIPVAIGAGDQFKPEFLAITPNHRIPAIVDPEGPDGKPFSLFESGAILIYLAEKAKSLADNPRQFQISAPVQPGNSGGPLLDLAGHVAGVVVAKLNAQRVAERTGDIPQNVNFAIKGAEAIAFLQANGVQPQLEDTRPPLRSAAEVGEIAHPSTVFLRCMR